MPDNNVSQNIFVSPGRKRPSQTVEPKPEIVPEAHKIAELTTIQQKIIHPKPVSKSSIEHIRAELSDINPNEHIIWIGRSSYLIHLTAYIFCGLFFWLLIPIGIAYYLYLQTKHTVYVLTEERLRVYSGIFVKRIDDLELYRVKDTAYTQPFIFRFYGLSNIQLYTSDVSWKDSVIPGIENGMKLREKIRIIVETAREKKGVREVDYYTSSREHVPGT